MSFTPQLASTGMFNAVRPYSLENLQVPTKLWYCPVISIFTNQEILTENQFSEVSYISYLNCYLLLKISYKQAVWTTS